MSLHMGELIVSPCEVGGCTIVRSYNGESFHTIDKLLKSFYIKLA